MANVNNVSMTLPPDYQASLDEINRQRALAAALQQQSMEPLAQPVTPSGGFTPRISWTQGLAKILQSYVGAKAQGDLTQKEQDLISAAQQRQDVDVAAAVQAGRGTPAKPAQSIDMENTPLGGMFANLPNTPDQSQQTASTINSPATPEVPGSPNAVFQSLATSKDPMLRAQGLAGVLRQAKIESAMKMAGYNADGTPIQSAQDQALSAGPNAPGYSPSTSSGSGGMSNAGGISPKALAMYLSDDPGLIKAGEAFQTNWQKWNEPKEIRANGGLVTPMGNGKWGMAYFQPKMAEGVTMDASGNSSMVPNYLSNLSKIGGTQAANAGLKMTAEEAAKFPGKVEMVTMANGAKVPQLLSGVVGNPYQQGNTPAVPAQQNRGAQFGLQPGAQMPPQSVMDAQQARQPFEATQAPGQQPQFNPNPGQSQGQANPWATVPMRNQPQGIGQSTFDQHMAEQQAKSTQELAQKFGQQAQEANQRIAINNQALGLVGQATTGTGAAMIGDVKNFLVSRLGIPESDFQESPSATAALQKDLVQAATAKAKQQFGSRITQSEVNLMLQRGSPGVDMPKAAINYLIQSDNLGAKYAIDQGNNFGHYMQIGGDPLQFEAWHAQAFPQTNALSQAKLNVSGIPKANQQQENSSISKQIGGQTYVKINGNWFRQ